MASCGPEIDTITRRPRTPNDQYTVLTNTQVSNIPQVSHFLVLVLVKSKCAFCSRVVYCFWHYLSFLCFCPSANKSIFPHCHTRKNTARKIAERGRSIQPWSIHGNYGSAFITRSIDDAAVWLDRSSMESTSGSRLRHVPGSSCCPLGCQQARYGTCRGRAAVRWGFINQLTNGRRQLPSA